VSSRSSLASLASNVASDISADTNASSAVDLGDIRGLDVMVTVRNGE
jgi:hypothetical protein